jgi:hypothetical protein
MIRTHHSARRLLLAFALAMPVACDSPASPTEVATVVVTPANQTLHSLGETTALTALAKDARDYDLDGRAITWTSSATNVVSVESGTATAVNNGEAVITATIDGVSASTKVYVDQVVTSLEMTPTQLTLQSLGEITRLTARPKDSRGNLVEGKVLAWTSSAPAIVAANTSGGVMAVANGSAIIAASVDGIAATSTVTVSQVPAKLAFVTQPITMYNGVTMPKVEVQVRDALGALVPDASNDVTIALVGVPGVTPLTGTTQVSAAAGVASFTSLAIGTPATSYTFSATSPNLAAATSVPFEVMNVPIRADSVKLAGSTIKVGGTLNYTIWITNGEGKNAAPVIVQAYIIQGPYNNAAGGTNVIGCTATGGVVAPGTCRTTASLNATIGTYTGGPAMVKIELQEGTTLRSTLTIPVTIVPIVP